LQLVTDEEGAFWLLSKIVEDLLVDYFTPSMLGLLVDQQVLAALVLLPITWHTPRHTRRTHTHTHTHTAHTGSAHLRQT
jgi:hypothetical protein